MVDERFIGPRAPAFEDTSKLDAGIHAWTQRPPVSVRRRAVEAPYGSDRVLAERARPRGVDTATDVSTPRGKRVHDSRPFHALAVLC